MPILLNEFIGFDPKHPKESCSHSSKDIHPKLQEREVTQAKPDDFFTVKIEAMHADFGTRNFTRYSEDGLRRALESWTTPYNAPVIMYHNDYDGEIVGRVLKAELAESMKMPGRCLLLTASIPDWKAQEDVRNGILSTVSIGASAKDVRCSICGAQLSEGEYCDHERGEVYDGQTCYWDVHEWEAKEISFVIVPSDKYAGVISYSTKSLEDYESGPKAMHESEDKGNAKQEPTDKPVAIHIEEQQHPDAEGKSKLDIKEAEAKIGSLETSVKALKGDKATLQESIDTLNNEKIQLQESVKSFKEQAEQKELEVNHERELREAAEKKVADMEKEVKLSLAESLSTLREKAGKPAIEKLAERSIDSLHDSIADLKAEMAAVKEAEKAEAKEEIKEAKGTVKDTSLQESAAEAGTKEPEAEVELEAEDFDL